MAITEAISMIFDQEYPTLKNRINAELRHDLVEQLADDLIKQLAFFLSVGSYQQKKAMFDLFVSFSDRIFELSRADKTNNLATFSKVFERINVYQNFYDYGRESADK